MSKADTLVSQALMDLAAAIELWTEKLTGKRLGFCLMVFSDEKEGTSSYISNTDRKLTAAASGALIWLQPRCLGAGITKPRVRIA